MKNIKPFGPSIGKTKLSRKFIDVLNKEFDKKSKFKKVDYSSKLASQINKELKISEKFIKKNLEKELRNNILKFLSNEKIKKIKEIKILNLWVVRQFRGEYNPIHYHEGDLSGVGYLKLPKGMTNNKMVNNKKIKTNGTIDFINGQKGFLSRSIYNVVPKIKELIIFPNYLMHTAYPFNIEGERRSFSFNAKIVLKK
ncbi:2OG-Fe(II) oxygenase family protein [Candidatus Pelagibacter sp.]|nr:2OG-Fe(II) oxygenase family protein [Candidatus Pelagibacter sp.]